jgi:hypothetical protein
MKHKISIFIITYNEAHIIAKCLEKLKTFDEIIVVDSGSTDATVSICESFGAKVISHKFENFGLQKQFALEQTNNIGKFTPNKVHETIEIKGAIGKLKQEMLHYTVFDINTAIQKQIKYALLSGELLHEKKKKSSVLKIVIKFPFDFIRYYFLQRNFLNGYEGFTWSMFAAFSNYLKYAKLKELADNNS